MQRQSEEALGLLAVSDEIVTSIETHGEEVAALLQEKWVKRRVSSDPTLQADGPSPPDVLGHLLMLRDGLNDSAASLGQADSVHVHHLAKLIELREDRQDLNDTAYGKFSTMRRTLDDLHGEGKAFVLAAIQGPTARTPKKLLRQIDVALPRLFASDMKLTNPKIEGVTVDAAAMAGDVEKVAEKLRQTQAEFQRTRRLVQASRKEKVRRMKEHRKNTVWTARIVEGYYQLAGETELAERLRPAVSRAGRPPAPAPDTNPVPEESAPDTGIPDDSAPDEPIIGEAVPAEGTREGLTLPPADA